MFVVLCVLSLVDCWWLIVVLDVLFGVKRALVGFVILGVLALIFQNFVCVLIMFVCCFFWVLMLGIVVVGILCC